MPQRLSMDNLRELYPEDKYILVLPAVSKHVQTEQSLWSIDVATVKIDPNNKRHCYPQSGEMALSAVAIGMIANAGDCDLITDRTDDKSNPDYARYVGVAQMKISDGDRRSVTRSAEWEASVQSDRVMMECENYFKDVKRTDPAEKEQMIQARYRKEWLDERRYGKRKIETAAASRAAAVLMGIQRTYQKKELATKEFAVVRFVLTPDTSNPEIVKLLISRGTDATRQLYGDAVQAAASQPLALPAAAVQVTAEPGEAGQQGALADAPPFDDGEAEVETEIDRFQEFQDEYAEDLKKLAEMARRDGFDSRARVSFEQALSERNVDQLARVFNWWKGWQE